MIKDIETALEKVRVQIETTVMVDRRTPADLERIEWLRRWNARLGDLVCEMKNN